MQRQSSTIKYFSAIVVTKWLYLMARLARVKLKATWKTRNEGARAKISRDLHVV